MTGKREWLQRVEKIVPLDIFVAKKGIKLQALEKGSVEFKIGEGKVGILDNVFFAPELGRNIISISCLIKGGCDVRFTGDGCLVTKGDTTVVEAKMSSNGLYVLKGENMKNAEAYATV